MRKSTNAFTIVELLIVIVVIAILAAISVVAYTGVQNRAYDSTVISDLANLKKKIELYKIDNDGLYPSGAGQATLIPLGFSANKGAYATATTTESNIWYCRNAAQSAFGVIVLSKSGNIYYISDTRSPTQYTGGTAWSTTAHNCNTMISSSLGWQYAGYNSTDSSTGPWRTWVGGN